jgi:flavin reductase (NADH)
MFVEASRIRVRTDGDGLIYFDRNFHRIKRVVEAVAN